MKLSECVCQSYGAVSAGAKKETKDEVVAEAAIWGIFGGVLALARLSETDAGVAAFLLAGGAPSWHRDDGTARMAGRTGTAARRSEGGCARGRSGRQWG